MTYPTLPVLLQRGFNNSVYYVAHSSSSSVDQVVMEQVFEFENGSWIRSGQVKEVLKVSEAEVVALETDIESKAMDSIYTYNNTLVERRPEAVNQLFVIDSKDNIFKLRQREKGSATAY